jgi:hypothetical protein
MAKKSALVVVVGVRKNFNTEPWQTHMPLCRTLEEMRALRCGARHQSVDDRAACMATAPPGALLVPGGAVVVPGGVVATQVAGCGAAVVAAPAVLAAAGCAHHPYTCATHRALPYWCAACRTTYSAAALDRVCFL